MRSLSRTIFTLAVGGATLAACSDQPESTPTSPLRPNSPRTAVALADSPLQVRACDLTVIKSDARAFANKSNDALLAIIGDIGTAQKTSQKSDDTQKAFDALARVAAIRGTTDQKAGVTGAIFDDLVRRLIGCADPAVYADALEPAPPTTQTSGLGFRSALGPGWVFEVRGNGGTTAETDNGAYERGSPPATWWAVEPGIGNKWTDVITSAITNNRILIYGYRTSFLEVSGKSGSSFDHKSVPRIADGVTVNNGVVVNAVIGLCYQNTADVSPNFRLNHDNVFLSPAVATCATPSDFTTTSGSLAFRLFNPRRLAERAFSLFSPSVLNASALVVGVSGSPKGWSPSAVYDLSKVTLKFDSIANGFINTDLKPLYNTPSHPLRVFALSPAGEPIPGVDIVLTIAGNSSTLAFFQGGASELTRTANKDGYAIIDPVQLTKAGGYQLAARVKVAGVTGTSTFISNLFNIQNKTP